MFTPLVLLALVTQTDGWIRITADQSDGTRVVTLERSRQPALATCREVSFASNGVDAVTESQFTILARVVVSRDGRIQRFRVARAPAIPIDVSTALRDALKEWRYNPMAREHSGDGFETTLTLPKVLGAVTTSGCERLTRQVAAHTDGTSLHGS